MSTHDTTAKRRAAPLHTRKILVVPGQTFTGARILRRIQLRYGWRIDAATDQGRIRFRVKGLSDEGAGSALVSITIQADDVAVVRPWGAIRVPPPFEHVAPAAFEQGSALATIAPPDTPAARWAIEALSDNPVPPLTASALADACFAQMKHELQGLDLLDGIAVSTPSTPFTLPSSSSKRASPVRYQRTDARFLSGPPAPFTATSLRRPWLTTGSERYGSHESIDARFHESAGGFGRHRHVLQAFLDRLTKGMDRLKRASRFAAERETCITATIVFPRLASRLSSGVVAL